MQQTTVIDRLKANGSCPIHGTKVDGAGVLGNNVVTKGKGMGKKKGRLNGRIGGFKSKAQYQGLKNKKKHRTSPL